MTDVVFAKKHRLQPFFEWKDKNGKRKKRQVFEYIRQPFQAALTEQLKTMENPK